MKNNGSYVLKKVSKKWVAVALTTVALAAGATSVGADENTVSPSDVVVTTPSAPAPSDVVVEPSTPAPAETPAPSTTPSDVVVNPAPAETPTTPATPEPTPSAPTPSDVVVPSSGETKPEQGSDSSSSSSSNSDSSNSGSSTSTEEKKPSEDTKAGTEEKTENKVEEEKKLETPEPTVAPENTPQAGEVSQSTGQTVVDPITNPVTINRTVANTNFTRVVGSDGGRVVVETSTGETKTIAPEAIGGKKNEDGTITVKDSNNKEVTLPHTGDEVFVSLVASLMGVAMMVGALYMKKKSA